MEAGQGRRARRGPGVGRRILIGLAVLGGVGGVAVIGAVLEAGDVGVDDGTAVDEGGVEVPSPDDGGAPAPGVPRCVDAIDCLRWVISVDDDLTTDDDPQAASAGPGTPPRADRVSFGDDELVVARTGDELLAVDLDDGTVRWRVPTWPRLDAPPWRFDGGSLLHLDEDGRLTRRDQTSGERRWTQTLWAADEEAAVVTLAARVDDLALVHATFPEPDEPADGVRAGAHLLAFDAETGARRWGRAATMVGIGAGPLGPAATGSASVPLPPVTVVIGDGDQLAGLDADGRDVWRVDAPDPDWLQLVGPLLLAAQDDSGELTVRWRDDGERLDLDAFPVATSTSGEAVLLRARAGTELTMVDGDELAWTLEEGPREDWCGGEIDGDRVVASTCAGGTVTLDRATGEELERTDPQVPPAGGGRSPAGDEGPQANLVRQDDEDAPRLWVVEGDRREELAVLPAGSGLVPLGDGDLPPLGTSPGGIAVLRGPGFLAAVDLTATAPDETGPATEQDADGHAGGYADGHAVGLAELAARAAHPSP